ncbi:hypothetical protein EGW08_007552 [Elysia chlorotica]|uniref:Uncharacterized protein n=1 Tax=Elysia chlorotica TaxID=188477 RepID=A0A433TSY2_ELYCH|nr:hypothetical protein EGW08_007552 [Elysia chlorotica]
MQSISPAGSEQSRESREKRVQQEELNDALVHASFLGDLFLVRWFLCRGSRVEYWQDPVYEECSMEQHTFRSSALLAACQQGHFQVVICLHKATTKSPREMPCNYWAILVETLKNRNRIMGKCTAQDDDGHDIDLDVDPFLHPFCFLENLALLKYLIDNGADLSVRGQSGKTPLMKASGSPRYSTALEMLLQAGADPNTLSRQHYSALVCAARKRNIVAMKRLLEHGASLEQVPNEIRWSGTGGTSVRVGGTACHALIYCVAQGYLPEAQLLVQWGARPAMVPRFLLYVLRFLDQSDLNHYTDCISYLHLAFYRCQPEMVQYLLEINFLSPGDLCSLRQDKDLLSHLIVEQEEEEETERDFASLDLNMNHSGGDVIDGLDPTQEESSDINVRKLPAYTTLSMYRDFCHVPPSLFTMCVMNVRRVYKTDTWLPQGEGVPNFKACLGLPKPLMKNILYASTWLSG